MSLLDIAQARKGKARDSVGKAKAGVSQAGTRVEYGTATAASADGHVEIIMDNGGAAFTVPCDSPIALGDRVSYISHAGQGKAVSLVSLTALAEQADSVASEAEAVANATNQHFWTDTDGVHVTEVTQDDWDSSSSSDYHSGANILINSLGILLRKALMNLVSITESAIAFYDGLGNAASNITAQFGKSGAQIGSETSSKMQITDEALLFQNAQGVNIATMELSGTTVSEPVTLASTIQSTYDSGTDSASMRRTVTFSTAPSSGATITLTLKFTRKNNNGQTNYIVAYPNASLTYTFGSLAALSGSMISTLGNTVGSYYIAPTSNGVSLAITIDRSDGISDLGSTDYTVSYQASAYDAPAFTFGTRGSSTLGAYSSVLGRSLRATNACTTALGRFNVNSDAPLVIGGGSSDADRFNPFLVTWTGAAYLQSSNLTDGTAPDTTTYGNASLQLRDRAGKILGMVQNVALSTGTQRTRFCTRRTVDGNVVENNINLDIAADGTRYVYFTETAPWQVALRHGAASRSRTSDFTLTAGADTKLTLNQTIQRTSANLFTTSVNADAHPSFHSNGAGGIKCLVAGQVLVSGAVYVEATSTATGGVQCAIYKGATMVAEQLDPYNTSVKFGNPTIPPILVTVAANDVIFLCCRSTNGGTVIANRAYLTVQYVS